MSSIQVRLLVSLLIVPLLAGCAGVWVGDDAPGFAAENKVTLSDLEPYQDKFVFMEFFGVWCVPCRESGPNVQLLHEMYAGDDEVVVLKIHLDSPGREDNVAGYMEEHGYTMPVVEDGRAIGEAYGVNSLPTFVLVSPDGEVLCRRQRLTEAELEEIPERIASERKLIAETQ